MELAELLDAEGAVAEIDRVVAWARTHADEVIGRGLEAELAALLGPGAIVVARTDSAAIPTEARTGDTSPGVAPPPSKARRGKKGRRKAITEVPTEAPIAGTAAPSLVETSPRFAAAALGEPFPEPASEVMTPAAGTPLVDLPLDARDAATIGATVVSTEEPSADDGDVEELELLDEDDLELVEDEGEDEDGGEGAAVGGFDAEAHAPEGGGDELPEWQRALVEAQDDAGEARPRTVTQPLSVVPGPAATDEDEPPP